MSSFISTKQHVQVCKRLEKEIESLRHKLRYANQVIAEWKRSQEATQVVADEWKRRARDLYTGKVVGVVVWFEEE